MSKLQSRHVKRPQLNTSSQVDSKQEKKKAFRMPGLKFPSIKKYFSNSEDLNLESETRTITTEPEKQPQRREAILPNVTKNSVGTTTSNGKAEAKTQKKSSKGVFDTLKGKGNAIRSRASKKFKIKSDEFDYSNTRTNNTRTYSNTNATGGNTKTSLEDKVSTPTTTKESVKTKVKPLKDIMNLPNTSSSDSYSSYSSAISTTSSSSSSSAPSSPSIKKKLPTPPTKRREARRGPEKEEAFEEQRKKPLPPVPRRNPSKTEVPQMDPTAPKPPERVKRPTNPRPKIPDFIPSTEKVEKTIQVKPPSRNNSGFTTVTITTTTTKQIPIPSSSTNSFGDPRYSNAVGIRSTSTPSSFASVGRSESSETMDNNMILARALHDFPGETLDDLTFWKGDVITILYMTDDGWWIGLLDENIGKLPSNFVEILPSHYYLARATADYSSRAKDELSFEENELILVTKEKGEWLFGEVKGHQGWFPFKYADQVCLTSAE